MLWWMIEIVSYLVRVITTYADRSIFNDDMRGNNVVNMIADSDNNRGEGGRPSNEKKQRHINGISLRDKLCKILQNHSM